MAHAPFKDWVLPGALERVRRKLKASPDGDRQMVEILGAVLTDGLPAVEAACAEALKEGVHSADPRPPPSVLEPMANRRRLLEPMANNGLDLEHLVPSTGSGSAGDDHDSRGAAAAARADRRLRPAHDNLRRANG